MSLPVSDFDSPHYKRRQQYSMRFKLSNVLGFIALVLFTGYMFVPLVQSYLPAHIGGSARQGSVANLATTYECERSYDGKKPVKQYVVMLDAGSSGSRVHVYEFSNCGPAPALVNEVFKMKKPGLSSFSSDPEAAAKSLDSLLETAVASVPRKLQKCTPVSVKATAGLRKIGKENASAILTAVRTHLETEWPFAVVDGDGISVMGGDDEGVYAWVTANYLLGNIGGTQKLPTVAVFDLGGGSTQIVFEPTFKDAKLKLADGDHKCKLAFGGRDFELYQHSYLGYGLNEAMIKLNSAVVKSKTNKVGGGLQAEYVNPCLPPNTSFSTAVIVPDGTTTLDGDNLVKHEITMVGPTVASPLQCRALAESILEKEAACALKPCAFNGVYQPRLYDAFPADSDLFVFSFFYDRTFPLGMPSSFSLNELGDLTSLVCRGAEAYSAFETVDGAVEALKKNPQWCGELSYMDALLSTGYEIKGHRDVKIAAKINGNELGWCLGASLPLLDQTNWKCRA